jgi:CheY-like chemotaxis protein
MCHELRTPLNGILGYAQILRRMDNLTAKQRHGVEVIQQAGTHLLNLINDVLDLAKVEARRLELVPQTVNLPALLNSITEVIRIKAEEKGLEFSAILDPNLPTGVFIDPKRLRQVLLNLLGNATKFTQHGAISLTVDCLGSSISTPMLDAEVMPIRFTVQDTGVGMTSEQVAKIFLPFEQVGKQAQRAEGTGLGLAISRQLVELMGGKLQVSSQLGEGSRFWFEVNLPIVQAWQDELTVSAEGKIIGYQGERRKILVVDDKAVNRLVVREVLEPLGFEIAEAEDGCQGLRQYEQFQPDLIVTDLVMPEMDGFELAREIRIGGDQQVIIIASSASVLAQDQDQSIIAGCNDFVPKPVEMELLLARIQKYLNLEWIYVQVAQEEESSNIQELIYPPPSELENLRHLAQLGDILGIRREVQRIRELDATYQVFCDRVLALANEFDDAGILQLLSV